MGRCIKKIRDFLTIPYNKPELLKAQYNAFSKQMPMMYCLLVLNSWALASSFWGKAPNWLSIYLPAMLTLLCIWRTVAWAKAMAHAPSSDEAMNMLRITHKIAALVSFSFAIWGLALFSYGDAYAQSHVAFYMAITVIGCVFCMMHLWSAAFIVAIIVNAAFALFFSFSGNTVFLAMTVNVVLVTIAMLIVLVTYYRSFTHMVKVQGDMRALINDNLRLANLDHLTELPNRRHFFSRLEEAFSHAKITEKRLAVGIIDLDGFKPINDLYGHVMGDVLLTQVGQRLQAMCGEDVHLSRLGGDEFALIVHTVGSDAALLALGSSIYTCLKKPFHLQEATIQVSCAVGFAVYPDLASDAVSLYERADYALYHAKRAERGQAILFSVDHDAEINRDTKIEQALHSADLVQELHIYFQPIVNIRVNKIIGFEALARWESPQLGKVGPNQFIPVAERAGIVDVLTRILLKKALCAAMKWPRDLRLSFNLSAKDISASGGVSQLVDIIRESGFPPYRLDFEITETAVMHDVDRARAAINMLKALGCGISLDDFGTGYSSLSQLHALPLTKIKVDRIFVTDLHIKPASYKIVRSLLTLSRDMGLDCVIEGVETESEMLALKALGGISVQGYYYSPPIPEDEVAHLLQTAFFNTINADVLT